VKTISVPATSFSAGASGKFGGHQQVFDAGHIAGGRDGGGELCVVTSVASHPEAIDVDAMNRAGIGHARYRAPCGVPRGSGQPMSKSPPGTHTVPGGIHRQPIASEISDTPTTPGRAEKGIMPAVAWRAVERGPQCRPHGIDSTIRKIRVRALIGPGLFVTTQSRNASRSAATEAYRDQRRNRSAAASWSVNDAKRLLQLLERRRCSGPRIVGENTPPKTSRTRTALSCPRCGRHAALQADRILRCRPSARKRLTIGRKRRRA